MTISKMFLQLFLLGDQMENQVLTNKVPIRKFNKAGDVHDFFCQLLEFCLADATLLSCPRVFDPFPSIKFKLILLAVPTKRRHLQLVPFESLGHLLQVPFKSLLRVPVSSIHFTQDLTRYFYF